MRSSTTPIGIGKTDAIRSPCEKHPQILTKSKLLASEERCLEEIDHVDPNEIISHHSALLHIFEDNEAVIKMIIKGRSPTMKHVSRTHRVDLHWLFDRRNLDLKFEMKNVDTRRQLADMLTTEEFTCHEWNHLLQLFNIMDMSVFSRSHVSFRSDQFSAMSKRQMRDEQEGKDNNREEEDNNRVVAKSRPARNPGSLGPALFSSRSCSDLDPVGLGETLWTLSRFKCCRQGETRCTNVEH